MAESIEDLFDCFDQAVESNPTNDEDKPSDDGEADERLVQRFLTSSALIWWFFLHRISEVNLKSVKRENEETEAGAIKRVKHDDVNVEDIK